ncbi:hypothetical protein ACLB2K_021736 [Fragaria x ananassa]
MSFLLYPTTQISTFISTRAGQQCRQPEFNILVLMINHGERPATPSSSTRIPTSTSAHAIFAFTVAVLVSFIQIKFPGTVISSSPFETHPTTIVVFIASLFSYCLSLLATKRSPGYAPTFCIAMRSSGLLALASLLSLLLPDSYHHGPYLTFIFYFVVECYQLLRVSIAGRAQQGHTLLPLTVSDLTPIN